MPPDSRPMGLATVAAIWLILAALATPSAAAEGWHLAQPSPPPPPPGQSSIGVPLPLGHIGEISFWAPNRGLLITAGSETIPGGLYYYNGVAWHELSTVCGGAEGRIAWAGENNFWTISNQQTGQLLEDDGFGEPEQQDRSLCHFEPGPSGKLEVVASYAEPLGVPDSYQHMDAAACSEPNNCWFGGERLSAGANSGAFHLHWNGKALIPLPSLEIPEPGLEDPPVSVSDIAFYKGHFYESVLDTVEYTSSGVASAKQPFYLHKIVEGSSNPFVSLLPEGPLVETPRLPEEREPFSYDGVGDFRFSADSSGLWAISGQDSPVLLLLGANGQFQQVKLDGIGEEVAGIAAEPGTDDAWVSLDSREGSEAVVAKIGTDGVLEAEDRLPEAGEGLRPKGSAGAIACPAQGDCWLATRQGWLFHLGGDYPEDNDPYFQGLITYRPPDASLPFEAPEDFPEDDSGDNPPSIPPPPVPPAPPATQSKVREALFSRVKEKLVSGTTLALTFTLATRSRVKLVALHKQRHVAHTKRYVLAGGRHTLKLRLSRGAWPTKLDLQVQAIGAVPLVPAGSEGTQSSGGPTVLTTSYRAPRTMPKTYFDSVHDDVFAPLPQL